MIVTDTPLPPPAENCTMLTVPAADCVPGLMAPRTKMSPQETVVRRQATTRTTRRRFTGHLQLQAAQTAAWYVEGRASRPSGGRGRPPLHQEVYTCALAPVVMEIVQTLALAQDADELFLCQEGSGLEEIRQRLQCRGGIHDDRQSSGWWARTYGMCFRNNGRARVIRGTQGAQHLQ